MLRHIIMFKLRDCESEVEKKALLTLLKETLEQLPGKIPQIREFDIGINICNTSWSYDIVINSVFDSIDDLESYKAHPAHQAFVKFNADKSIAKSVVDYYF
ncbi:MAG: Dabb family protein [Bacteroidales bacterium]